MTVKLSDADAEWIRLFAAEMKATPRQLSRAYAVHPDTIRDILKGKSHRGKTRRDVS